MQPPWEESPKLKGKIFKWVVWKMVGGNAMNCNDFDYWYLLKNIMVLNELIFFQCEIICLVGYFSFWNYALQIT